MKYFFSDKCEEGAISITEDAFCEHCYELEPFTPLISNGGTWYCICCHECSEEDIPEDIMKEITKREKELKTEYYTKKLKELKGV